MSSDFIDRQRTLKGPIMWAQFIEEILRCIIVVYCWIIQTPEKRKKHTPKADYGLCFSRHLSLMFLKHSACLYNKNALDALLFL